MLEQLENSLEHRGHMNCLSPTLGLDSDDSIGLLLSILSETSRPFEAIAMEFALVLELPAVQES